MEDIYNVASYSDNELFAVLDLVNPTDRELEAKILHMIWKYENMGNKSGDRLARFFKEIFDHFFEDSENEGFENMTPSIPIEQEASSQPPVQPQTPNYSVSLDFSKDTLNPLMKQSTKRLVSVDSQYRDKKSISTDYTFNLSDPLKDVVNMKLYSIQIPYTWYTISNSFGSNLIYLKGNAPGITDADFDIKIEIGTGNYTAPDLVTAVNNSIIALKVNPIYKDINFGTTAITYDYPSSKATFKFDISKTYNESNFRITFPYWTSPNDADRRLSIPSFLGFNSPSYIPNVVLSKLDLLPLSTSPLYNTDITISQYKVTAINKTFTIYLYTSSNVSTEYITSPAQCTVIQTIPVTLDLNVNTLYSRSELFTALNYSLANNAFLSDSNIQRVNISNTSVNTIGYGYSHYELHLNLNRRTTSNIPGAKVAVVFPQDTSADVTNDLWVGINSSFVFENTKYELSNIISETKTSQSTIIINSNPFILFKCTAKYFNGIDNNGDIIVGGNTTLNNYSAIISDSVGAGYTLSEYISEINSKLVSLNTATSAFRIDNTKLMIDNDSKIDFRIDINKQFTETSYDVDLLGTTFLRDKLGFQQQLYTTYTVIDNQNGITSSQFPDPGGSGILLEANRVILVIRPKSTTSNRYVPPYIVMSGPTNVTSTTLKDLEDTLNLIFQSYLDPTTSFPVLQGTTIKFERVGSNIVSRLTVTVRKTLTQTDFDIRFVDPNADVASTRILSLGSGMISYSSDNGASWTNSSSNVFSIAGYGLAKNTNRWIAVGEGTVNTIASSITNGTTWTGLGTSIFSVAGRGVAWNGTNWVAVGEGSAHTIAYSSDNGVTWTGIGKTIFTQSGYGITWNGNRFIATGKGTNTLAYSSNGINWTGIGSTVFSTVGYSVLWSGVRLIAMGEGTGNTIAYSNDNGVTWTGIGKTIFTAKGQSVTWNGNRYVATGSGGNTLAHSTNGINWTGLGATIFSQEGIGVSRTASSTFVASGWGINTIATSTDGVTWTGRGTSISSIALSYDICDNRNSWIQNLQLGRNEYNMSDVAYSSMFTYSDIIGANKVASDTIVLTANNNMNRITIEPITIGLTSIDNSNVISFDLPSREYTRDQLITAINNALNTTTTPYNSQTIAKGSLVSVINNEGEYVKLRLNISKTYTASDFKLVFYDPFSFVQCFTGASSVRNTTWDSTLGWILGFRTSTEYELVNGTTITGDNVVSVNIYNYFMIVLDDYNHNHMNDGIVTTTQQRTDLDVPSYANRSTYRCDPATGNVITSSLSLNGINSLTQKQTYATQEIINHKKTASASKKYSPGPFTKNVFALIPLNIAQLNNNSIYVEQGSALEIHQRSYFGPVNLQRMTVKLVNDRGETVDLNGANWSFSFICEQLYSKT